MFGVLIGSSGEEAVRIHEGCMVIVGREIPEGEQGLIIEDIFTSRLHAEIGYKKDFYIKDAGSKNGSFINGRQIVAGIPVPLEDGDVIAFGRAEYCFRIGGNQKGEKKRIGPFVCSMRNSAGGRRLQVELQSKGFIDYQLKMIEENEELGIADIIPVNGIDRDSFLYDVGGCFNLKVYVEQVGRITEPLDFIGRILSSVEKGEEHLLERGKYLINEETLFVDKDEEVRLIYVPCSEELKESFAESMEGLCNYFAKIAEPKDKEALEELAAVFKENDRSLGEYIKGLYSCKAVKSIEKPFQKKEEGKRVKWMLKKQYIITFISYLIFLLVFWLDIVDMAGLCGVFIGLAGLNVLLYEIPEVKKEEKNTFSLLSFELFKKKSNS